jgi:SAM-dependent methyltransferase
VLDVGCGDGALAALLRERRPDIRVEGVDVLVREHTAIPVRRFDGIRIPYDDKSVDVVLMVDVLHHTDDPTVLLRESTRVARFGVLIKDHVLAGFGARLTLRGMDWVGNARHGVRLPYTYWSRAEWDDSFDQLGLIVRSWHSALHLYPAPASWLFDRSLHFIAELGIDRR